MSKILLNNPNMIDGLLCLAKKELPAFYVYKHKNIFIKCLENKHITPTHHKSYK